MALSTDDIFQAAFDLCNDDRRQLVERLLETLPESDADDIDSAWKAEIRRRIRAIDDGTEQLIPAEEVFSSLRREVKQ